MKSCFLLAFFFLIFLIVFGCAQRETDIGSNAITGQPNNEFTVVADTATVGTDWKPPFPNGGGTSLEIGNAKFLYSFIAIRFNVTSGLPDSIVPDSLWIRFFRASTWPAEGIQEVQVRVRQVPDSVTWTERTLVPGSMPSRESYALLDSAVLSGSSADSFATLPVANALTTWRTWLADSTTRGGLVIEPRSDVPGGRGGFIEYYSHENSFDVDVPPALFIHGAAYRNDTLLSADTTIQTFATDDAYLVIDSTDINPVSQAAHAQRLLISQGMAQRAALFFPLDTLNANFTRAVNRAELHLFADTSNPLIIAYPQKNVLLKNGFLNRTSWITNHDSLQLRDMLGPESVLNGTWDATSTEITFDVTTAVNSWVQNPGTNAGLQILSSEELDYLAREAFYSPDADSLNKRPKLLIWFTETSSSH